MKTLSGVMVVLGTLIVACSPDLTQDRPWANAECSDECTLATQEGCGATALCVELDVPACGMKVTRCEQDKCRTEFKTTNDPYKGQVTVKTYDSCGDGYECNLTTQKCDEVKPVPVTPDEPVVENPSQVVCCYDNVDPKAYLGQMSWSAVTPEDPNGWGASRDKTIDADGCYSDLVDLTKVTGEKICADITLGKAEANGWVGAATHPKACSINALPAKMDAEFTPNRGWCFWL